MHGPTHIKFARHYTVDQIQNYKMDYVCGTHEGERNTFNILLGNPMEIDHFEDLDTDRSLKVKIIFKEIVWEGPD